MRYRWDPPYPASRGRSVSYGEANVRASDAERNEVADKLSRHFAEGRLDQIEFKERLDRAMGATTRGDLDGLFDDLPRLTTEPAAPPPRRRRMIPLLFIIVLFVVAAGSTLSFFSDWHVPWLLVFVAAAFVWHRAGGRRHHYLGRSSSEVEG